MLLAKELHFSFFNFKLYLSFVIENFSVSEKLLSAYDDQSHKPKIQASFYLMIR